jgi:hypothetical protein
MPIPHGQITSSEIWTQPAEPEEPAVEEKEDEQLPDGQE